LVLQAVPFNAGETASLQQAYEETAHIPLLADEEHFPNAITFNAPPMG
jgi:hypothetical protein